MSDIAPRAIYGMYGLVHPHVTSMEQSGIVGDASHTYGYHCSRNRIAAHGGLHSDYSVIDSPRDRAGNPANASAIDMKFSPADMRLVTGRLLTAGKAKDPRLHAMRSCFGTLDGLTVTGWSMLSNKYVTSSDKTHLWHIHVSIFRDCSDNTAACAAVAAVISGIAPPKPPPAKPVAHPATDRFWLSLVLEARHKEIHAPRAVKTHAETVTRFELGLRAWGFTGPLLVDGHYGTSTDDAVKWFQAKVSPGITPTGVMGPLEWARFAGGPDGKPLFIPELGDYQKWQ